MTTMQHLFTQEELDALCLSATEQMHTAITNGDTRQTKDLFHTLTAAMRDFGNIYVGWTASIYEFLSQGFSHEALIAASRPEPGVTGAIRMGLTEDEVRIAAEIFAGPDSAPAQRMAALLEAGDLAGAKHWWTTIEDACRRLHDFRRDWTTAALSHVYRTHGQTVLERCLRYSSDKDWWEQYMLADIEQDPKERVRGWALMRSIRPFLRFSEPPLMSRKDLIEGAVILGTAQGQHLIAVELIPPGSRALEPYMADELVG